MSLIVSEDIAVGDYIGFYQNDKPFLSTHIHFKIWYDSISGVKIDSVARRINRWNRI